MADVAPPNGSCSSIVCCNGVGAVAIFANTPGVMAVLTATVRSTKPGSEKVRLSPVPAVTTAR